MTERLSFAKALQDFLSRDPHGKKYDIPEFKALTYQDKVELREMLIQEGYDVDEVVKPGEVTS